MSNRKSTGAGTSIKPKLYVRMDCPSSTPDIPYSGGIDPAHPINSAPIPTIPQGDAFHYYSRPISNTYLDT